MKKPMIQLATITMLAIASSTAHAGSKTINQGRAGTAIVRADENRDAYRYQGTETRVALVMDTPGQKPKFKTMGRAGYRVIPGANHGR